MNRKRAFLSCTGLLLAGVLCAGCPDGGPLDTFDLYIINGTSNLTIGLVGLDNQLNKALVDVLEENIPPNTMTRLRVSQAAYGVENGTVQIGIVNVGFFEADNVMLGPDPVVILVEAEGQVISARALNFS